MAKALKQKLIAHTSIYSAIYGSTSLCDIIHRPVPRGSVLARLGFFKKKELFKFFRELFANERSYPFHGENLANGYQIRILYARTCRNN